MPTLDYQISAAADDAAEAAAGGGVANNGQTLSANASGAWAAIRFTGVTIPAGATITSAYLDLCVSATTADVMNNVFDAADAADPSMPTAAYGISSLTGTTATKTENRDLSMSGNNLFMVADGESGVDVAAIISELIASYDYSSGSAMLFRWTYAGSGATLGVRTYDNSSARGAKLHIEYEVASGPEVVQDTADEAEFTTATPELLFTGTDPGSDDIRYEIQISDNAEFEDGDQTGDSCTTGGGVSIHPNPATSASTWDSEIQVDDRPGQSFTSKGGILDEIHVKIGDRRSVTDGTAVIRIYAHEGTYGTSSAPADAVSSGADTPTPDWLAESDSMEFSGVGSGSDTWYTFTFSGANRIRLTAGEYYVFILDWRPADRDYDNTFAALGATPSTHAGNLYIDGYSDDNLGPQATWDLFFEEHLVCELIDAVSGTDAGFANKDNGGDTDPFNSGDQVGYTVQSALDNGTYFWRVRAKDPSGTDTWTDWSATRTFTIATSGGGGSALLGISTETETSSEALLRLEALVRSLAETETLSDAVLRNLALARILSESETLSEGGLRNLGLSRSLGEVETLGDGTRSALGLVRLLAEIESVSESSLRSLALARVLSETENVGSGSLSLLGILRLFSETVQAEESVLDFRGLIRLASETESLSEAVTRALVLRRIQAETERLEEALTRLHGMVRPVNETEAAAEVLARALTMVRHRSEVESGVEGILGARGLVRLWSESVSLVETLAFVAALVYIAAIVGTIRIFPRLAARLGVKPALVGSVELEPALDGRVDLRPQGD